LSDLFFNELKTAALSSQTEFIEAHVHDDAELEDAIAGLGRVPNSGLVVMTEIFTTVHQKQIVTLAARHSVPTVYPFSFFVRNGGLMSYGVDIDDTFRRAASYVDRVLKGEKPADLPVQAPTKFEVVINLKTAKALGLTIPESFVLRANEVIE
jgi:putative ABC transport system substrate-binding protein